MSLFEFICVVVLAVVIAGALMHGFNYLVFNTMDKIDDQARKDIEELMKERDEK